MGLQEFQRLTTSEAAKVLGCTHSDALHLLKAASVKSARMGSCGPHLWDSQGVIRLAASLRSKKREERP